MADRGARTVVLLDYGVGNLRSVERALMAAGAHVVRSADVDVPAASALVLPGVGAFAAAKNKLGARFDDLRRYAQTGRPLLGICLGMQLLFDKSFEHGEHEGLSLLPGAVEPLPQHAVVPHMGWARISTGEVVYFCHSYAVKKSAHSIATVNYAGADWTASVALGKIHAFQFHPEKSGPVGIALLRRWLDVAFAEQP